MKEETPKTHIQKILEAIQIFKKHDTSITLPPEKWVSVFSAMEEYASIRAEQAWREERERLEKEIKYYRSTLADIAGMAAESYDSCGDYRNTLAHIQTDASWALLEYDKNETEGK